MSVVKIAVEVDGDFIVQNVFTKPGMFVQKDEVLFSLKDKNSNKVTKIKAPAAGKADKVHKSKGNAASKGDLMMELLSGECDHQTVMKNMCAECGADLEQDMSIVPSANKPNRSQISIVHSIPELKISSNEAQNLGREDEKRLLNEQRLVLLVDLDQTLIHTTNENIPANMRDVKHFRLHGNNGPWYHTKIRPKTEEFLEKISKLFELHIVTFGARMYAHTIAQFLDPGKKYFSHRILSRDECFDTRAKTANLSSLFPCGDHMVCIIDDREDVWSFAPNLVHVKPYIFFKNTGDINAPPGSKDKKNSSNSKAEKTEKDQTAAQKPSFERRESIDMPSIGGNGDTTKKPTERNVERRDSIDMPSIGEDLDEDKQSSVSADQDAKSENNDAVSMVSDDLELSDDDEDSNDSITTNRKKAENLDKVPETSEIEVTAGSKVDTTEDETKDSKEPESSKNSSNQGSEEEDDDLNQIEDHDDYLSYLEDILMKIHKAYYDLHKQNSGKDVDMIGIDIKNVIPYVKRKVLENTRIVFSGVVPTHIPLEKSKAYMIAHSLGAKVQREVRVKDKVATHLVAARGGTAKVNEARRFNEKNKSNPIHLVTPDWLWCCAERWEKAEEAIFPLYKSAQVTLKPPAHCSSPEIAFAERCPPVQENLPEAVMNPFLALGDETLKSMRQELDDELTDSDSSSSSESDTGSKKEPKPEMEMESSEDSLTSEMPKGRKRKKSSKPIDEDTDSNDGPADRFRRGEHVPSDYEIASQSDDDDDVRMKVATGTGNDYDKSNHDPLTDDDGEEDEEDDELGAQLEREFLKDCNSSRSSFTND